MDKADLTLIVSLATPVVFGLGTWIGKVWADRIARSEQAQLQRGNDLLKSQLDSERERNHIIFSKRFELEFELYRRLWEAATDLFALTGELRPLVSWGPLQEEEQAKQDKLAAEAVRISLLNFKRLYLANRPYASDALYSACDKLEAAAYLEFHALVMRFAYNQPFATTWQDERKLNLESANSALNELLEEIRAQLKTTSTPSSPGAAGLLSAR